MCDIATVRIGKSGAEPKIPKPCVAGRGAVEILELMLGLGASGVEEAGSEKYS